MTNRNTVACRSCGAPMIFLPTKGGKLIPCNAATVQETDTVFDSRMNRAHFADCPGAKQHRRAHANAPHA